MIYSEAIDYLYRQAPMFQQHGAKAYKSGLENTVALDAVFDHPHRAYKTIHVAGTWIVGLTIGGSVEIALQLLSQSVINWF